MNEYCTNCHQSSYPLVRSSWARAALIKIENDRCLKSIDRTKWYRLSRSDLLHDEYRERFYQLNEDEDTQFFLKQSEEKSENVFLQMIHTLFASLLTLFMTRTSANGLLGRGRMFVYSSAQFKTLLDIESDGKSPFATLLDIGAGDGSITERMANSFNKVYVTELSPTMRWRLSTYGYTVLDTNHWGDHIFDVITCLNVLDRCENPVQLLKQIRDHLNPQIGRVILSLVLPFKPYFEYNSHHRPNESLQIEGELPEEQINSFLLNVIQPSGFHLEKLTRVPYLCEGDMERSYYFLFDYVFVLAI
ncbi:unnamed protein product [Adineta ricciae]|uniref:Methyltransferase-like protein 9 n=1 Tax=Adineta ricciae TaxID=249248 RepID=A0A813W3N3_ADIRI|nr:unnamed protein product [Adineta ricciae]CAF0849518.1 unnamed protein product [Adineta ricciae]